MMNLLLEMKNESRQLNKKFEHVIEEQGKAIAKQEKTIKNIEKNLGYVTQQLNTRPQRGLLSDTVPNPKSKEPYCAVTLSSKMLKEPSQAKPRMVRLQESMKKHESEEGETLENEEEEKLDEKAKKYEQEAEPVEIVNEEQEEDSQDQSVGGNKKRENESPRHKKGPKKRRRKGKEGTP